MLEDYRTRASWSSCEDKNAFVIITSLLEDENEADRFEDDDVSVIRTSDS